ncbi:MAG: RdgB/HAM1 family non-canonical purine NTP pyrophosphatase [Defluviitaleaceae bacterium]|nr:RdgB/HAM1 family non-canonical purine NTP pyrophosphatase [Defluviitaleaceae bacterium]
MQNNSANLQADCQGYVLATNNPSKVAELNAILESRLGAENFRLIALSDLGLALSPEETGTTFEENAIIKANETAALLKKHGHEMTVLADDSGLCIDAMDGELGVNSALYMGAGTPYSVRIAEILKTMQGVPDDQRTARFVCVIACVAPDGKITTTTGVVEGRIANSPSGKDGFGYDPIFYLPEYDKTMSELSSEEKNAISHRGQAFNRMLDML